MRQLTIFLGVFVGVIILQNWHSVPVQIIFWQFRISQIVLLTLTLLAGVALGYFWGKRSW